MKFATFLDRNVSMHFAFHNHGLALHLAAHISILTNCQNTVDRGKLALQISIQDKLIYKLDRAFNFDVLREVILIGWYICHNGGWLCYSERFSGRRSSGLSPDPASSAGAVCPGVGG